LLLVWLRLRLIRYLLGRTYTTIMRIPWLGTPMVLRV